MNTANDGARTPRRISVEADDATQDLLRRAAVSVLERDGVLAGINLQEVADLAGVNRSTLYHHFGSRRELLRAALYMEGKEFRRHVIDDLPRPYSERVQRFFRAAVTHARAVALTALLVLDGDDRVRALPFVSRTMASMWRDLAKGLIREGLDVEVAHLVVMSAIYGYAIYRPRFSAEMDIPLGELDRRYGAVLAEFVSRGVANSVEG